MDHHDHLDGCPTYLELQDSFAPGRLQKEIEEPRMIHRDGRCIGGRCRPKAGRDKLTGMKIEKVKLSPQNYRHSGTEDKQGALHHCPQKDPIMENPMEYEKTRQAMVERQLISRGIQDPRVLDAMASIPRHLFIPEEMRELAYADQPLPIDRNQTISQPYIVALMTEALELSEDDTVLEIGTGSGYQAAILAELSKLVYTVEKYPELLETAATVLQNNGYTNIVAKMDDGTMGWPEYKPYDAIIVTAGAPHVPQPLLDQLADGGRLLIPVGDGTSQELLKLTRNNNDYSQQSLGGCRFVPLQGEHGWQM